MARSDKGETSGAADDAATRPVDDLKALLDELAVQLTDVGARHTESLDTMQARATALADRAAAARPEVPSTCAETFERVEGAIVNLAERLNASAAPRRNTPAFDHADPDDRALPDTVRSEVRRAIFNADRASGEPPPALRSALSDTSDQPGLPREPSAWNRFGRSGEETFAGMWEPAPAATAPDEAPIQGTSADTEAPTAATVHRAWLEDRFADIAGRVEQSIASINPHNALISVNARFDQLEQRFDTALNSIMSRIGTDDGLRSVERQIADIAAHLDRTQAQLGRLDHIERRISELRQSLSEEQMKRLVGALSPSDNALSAVAMAAAERVAEHIRADRAAEPAPEPDPRLGELTAMLQEFIGEQRRGDANTAEALDTMQLAMQHLIDRVEAIETLQLEEREGSAAQTALPAISADAQAEAPSPPRSSEGSGRVVIASGTGPVIDPVVEPARSTAAPAQASEIKPATSPDDSVRPEPATAPRRTKGPGGDIDRSTLVAMARRAAEKASSGAEPVNRCGPPSETAPLRRPEGRVATALANVSSGRPGALLVVTFAAFLLAGFWMVAGNSVRVLLPGASQTVAPTVAPATGSTEQPVHQQGRVAATGSFPAARVVAGGVGIAIDEGSRVTVPDVQLKAREQIEMASLSAQAGEQHARRSTLPSTVSTSALLAAVGNSGDEPDTPREARPSMSRGVEMPPAMIGPLSLRHAAAQGDAAAQFEVAARFAEGKGVPQDFGQAATWYQRAAGQGLAVAQYRLATLYERGLGVSVDPARARVWYGRAANQGNVRAMHNLAVLSASNAAGGPDYPTAVQWFSEAAAYGLGDSQYNLGILYESGLGVPMSQIDAYKWYALAARKGDKDATRRRDTVRSKLDPASLRSADALVISWRPKPIETSANDARETARLR